MYQINTIFAIILSIALIVPNNLAFSNTLSKNREVLDQIGSRLAFFEHKYGPFKDEIENLKIFEISGCEFTVVVDNKNYIKYITLKITKKCDVIPKYSKLGPVSRLQMKDLYQKNNDGHFLKPSCLMNCGNMTDPTIIYVINSPHSENFITKIITTDLPDDLGNQVEKDVGKDRANNDKYEIGEYETFIRDNSSNQKILDYGEGYAIDDNDIVQ